MAENNKSRVKHLKGVGASVQLKAGKLKVCVDIPWSNLEKRFGTDLPAKEKFRKKRSAPRAVEASVPTE